MDIQFERKAGIMLIVGSVLMIVTMILHPAGDMEDRSLIIGTHVLALLSIPISLVGFWGVTRRICTNSIFSLSAFITMSIGLFAAMCAAAISGLAYPMFRDYYLANSTSEIDIDVVLTYSFALNQAMALIYVGAMCVAMLLWSVAILQTIKLPKWLAYFGILLSAGYVILLVFGVNLTDLDGFRLFIFGSVTWVITAGYLLAKSTPDKENTQP